MVPLFRYFFLPFVLLLFLSKPCFPARTVPEPSTNHLTVITANANNHTWSDFQRFLDVGKGSHISGISKLKNYFQRFGYVSTPDMNFTDTFDPLLESAVAQYQAKLGLRVSGIIDSDTLVQMSTPRCGVKDTIRPIQEELHHSTFSGKPRWNRETPMTLTYAFSPDNVTGYLSLSTLKDVFGRAFGRWEMVIPVNFRETEDFESANVKIGFYNGAHGDGEPFDGVLGVLAHAFSPENGRLHLDAAETWAVDFETEESSVAIDLESVATHEIGHVLGLGHSSVNEAIMYPSLGPRMKKVELKLDDVEGVQALYGSNPNFSISSLQESANQGSTGLKGSSKLVFLLVALITCMWI